MCVCVFVCVCVCVCVFVCVCVCVCVCVSTHLQYLQDRVHLSAHHAGPKEGEEISCSAPHPNQQKDNWYEQDCPVFGLRCVDLLQWGTFWVTPLGDEVEGKL